MSETVVRVFDSIEVAERARDALLDAGFSNSRVHLVAKNDEAGPVESNFAVGNGNRSDESYGGNFAPAANRGDFLLTVETADEQEYQQALALLDDFQRARDQQQKPPPSMVF